MKPPFILLAASMARAAEWIAINRIEPARVRVVTQERDILGLSTEDRPLVALTDWYKSGDACAAYNYWLHRGGRIVSLVESEWKGSCRNDTDRDGDCHLCHKKGGCPWPLSPS